MIAIAFLVVVLPVCLSYDYSSSCARPPRSMRARMPPDVPCDLSKQTYCTTPGTNYPWHAIRRFVRENQGLMKRMYGEERHISVLKAELENFIEEDDFKTGDYVEDLMKKKMMYSMKSQGRAMKDKPYFRPIQNVDKNKKIYNETLNLRVKPLQYPSNSSTKPNITETKNKTEAANETTEDKGISYKTKLESIANIEINNLDPDVITLEAVIKQSVESSGVYSKFNGNVAKLEPVENKNETVGEATASTENSNSTYTTTVDNFDETTTESDKDGWKPMMSDTSTLPPTLLYSEHDKNKIDRIDTKMNEKKEEPNQKPVQETIRPAVIKLRGANACESKEEMAAPFWANSTRGEVLALLNMYPFEQYIHLETCVHERKQMYCREGCRCEQQYRLHRLLAYDPRNECRGIFADWFKFPACCVCKCYDVPLEFRARSPRILPPQYDEHVKRAILNDAARWSMIDVFANEDEDLF